jgi:hypothetical protein
MKLDAIIDNKTHRIEIEDSLLTEAGDFFARMDRDMDGGWRMAAEYVESPDTVQRCQIAADRLLSSLSTRNEAAAHLMAAYILKHLPGVVRVNIDTGGEIGNTEFTLADGSTVSGQGHMANPVRRQMTDDDARQQAEKDVTTPYKVGRAWKFACLDSRTGRWQESGFIDGEAEAGAQRATAVEQRYRELTGRNK